MMTTTACRVLNLAGLGIPVHGLPGPALLGESGTQILMVASGEAGEPAPGVHALFGRPSDGSSLEGGLHALILTVQDSTVRTAVLSCASTSDA